MNRVWDKAHVGSNQLLVLLALADRADEDGICWPGVAYLAERARVQDRQVQRIIQELVRTGELVVQHGTGRGFTNHYLVVTGLEDGDILRVLTRRLNYTAAEAQQVLAGILQKRQMFPAPEPKKGVKNDTLSKLTKGDIDDTLSGEKGDVNDTHSRKRVSSMTPDPLTLIESDSDTVNLGGGESQNSIFSTFPPELAPALDIITAAEIPITNQIRKRLELLAADCADAAQTDQSSGAAWVIEALRLSLGSAQPASLLNYAESVIRRWKTQGGRSAHTNPPARRNARHRPPSLDADGSAAVSWDPDLLG